MNVGTEKYYSFSFPDMPNDPAVDAFLNRWKYVDGNWLIPLSIETVRGALTRHARTEGLEALHVEYECRITEYPSTVPRVERGKLSRAIDLSLDQLADGRYVIRDVELGPVYAVTICPEGETHTLLHICEQIKWRPKPEDIMRRYINQRGEAREQVQFGAVVRAWDEYFANDDRVILYSALVYRFLWRFARERVLLEVVDRVEHVPSEPVRNAVGYDYNALSDLQRKIIDRRNSGLTVEKIAELLGEPLPTVRRNLYEIIGKRYPHLIRYWPRGQRRK